MQKWNYMFLACYRSEGKTWTPRFINGQEIPNWSDGQSLYKISDDLGQEGWELIGIDIQQEVYRLVFKRPVE